MAGVAAALAGIMWHTGIQREKEKQLLFAGSEIRDAIGRYYLRTPGTSKEFPRRLEDLLLDSRYPTTERYLRKIYTDPFTGKPDWEPVIANGRIVGVHSAPQRSPLKLQNFKLKDANFKGKTRYSEWVFEYRDNLAGSRGARTALSIGETETVKSGTGNMLLRDDGTSK